MSDIADLSESIDRPSETNWDDEPLPTPAPLPQVGEAAAAETPVSSADRSSTAAGELIANSAPEASPPPEPAATPETIDSQSPIDSSPVAPAPIVTASESAAPPADSPDRATPAATSSADPDPDQSSTPNLDPELDASTNSAAQSLADRVADLQTQRDQLLAEIAQARRDLSRILSLGTAELEQRRQNLTASIEQLERRQERIRQEMKSTFAGASQNVAARVQGFKDYLVGSLQELVAAAEELSFAPPPAPTPAPTPERSTPTPPTAIEGQFQGDRRKIEQILERYRTRPDYYGPPWRLRRTFEQVHADRVSQWFFDLSGRGALRTMGSRLQNILVVSATISVLRAIHGDRLRTLILIDSPERLGDWRRGLQDSLGISRADFGAEQGVMLFESPDPLAQRADRIQRGGGVPFIVVDESDGRISLSLLQFPLWLAIAPDPRIAPPSGLGGSSYDY
ncbi:MAG: DUF3086 domain-containing protein [Limnothrix sp. BL-A-16]